MPKWREEVLAEGVRLIQGDCREVLPTLGNVDAVVTDPPYGIGFPYRSYVDSAEALEALIPSIMDVVGEGVGGHEGSPMPVHSMPTDHCP